MKKILPCLLLLLIACNKGSNQLPGIKADPLEISETVRLNSNDVFVITFTKTQVKGHDTVWFSLRNLTGEAIDSVVLAVEVFTGTPLNYDKLANLQILKTGRIAADSTSQKVQIGIDTNFPLDTALVNIGILYLGYANKSKVQTDSLAGIYSSNKVGFYKLEAQGVDTTIRDTVYEIDTTRIPHDTTGVTITVTKTTITDTVRKLNATGYLRGYVTVDGSFVFRVKASQSAFYNMSGNFNGSNELYNSILTKENGEILSELRIAPVQGNSPPIRLEKGELKFGILPVTKLTDNDIDSIYINAIKQ